MLEEPVVEREEEWPAEEVGDGALGDGHRAEAPAAEQVGEQVAGVVEQAPLGLGLVVDAGRLAPDDGEAPPPAESGARGVATRRGVGLPRVGRGGGGGGGRGDRHGSEAEVKRSEARGGHWPEMDKAGSVRAWA